MKLALIISAVVIGGLILLAGILAIWGVGTYNSAASLKNQYDAKVKANEALFDNMWKKISQSAQVTDAQKDALKEIFTSYAEARTGTGSKGSFASMVTEAIPQVDTSVYKNLQNIITGARDEWTANQVALVDIAREYNRMLAVFPSNILLGAFSFQKLDPKVITSSRTGEAFRTGKDDDTDLKLKRE